MGIGELRQKALGLVTFMMMPRRYSRAKGRSTARGPPPLSLPPQKTSAAR